MGVLFLVVSVPATADALIKNNKTIKVTVFAGHLNDDNVKDRIRILSLSGGNNIAVFEVSNKTDSGTSLDFLSAVEFSKNHTESPTVEFRDTGEISFHTGCTATCGRYDHHIEYKIVYRNETLILVGYTHIQSDRIEAKARICDVNMLNQRAEVGIVGENTTLIKHTDKSFPLQEMPIDYRPKICVLGYHE